MVELQENVIYFVVGINTSEISAYIENPIFAQKIVSNLELPRQIFP